MIFTGNKKMESSYRIMTMEGRLGAGMSLLGAGMSLWALEMIRAQRIQGEAMRSNQIIFMNYEMATVEMEDFFSRIVDE